MKEAIKTTRSHARKHRKTNIPAAAPAPALQRSPLGLGPWVSAAIAKPTAIGFHKFSCLRSSNTKFNFSFSLSALTGGFGGSREVLSREADRRREQPSHGQSVHLDRLIQTNLPYPSNQRFRSIVFPAKITPHQIYSQKEKNLGFYN